ncbi:MAG: sulfatase [Akkermansiaceae bacterium]
MKFLLPLLLILSLHAAAEKPNVLFISIDDLRCELPSYGKKHIIAPNIEKLASQGRLFKRHYVQAPTCGVSRFSLLTGLYPKGGSNNMILGYYKKPNPAPSLPHTFKKAGYTTVSIGKISHYPGNQSGKDWNDPSKPEIPGAWSRALMPCGPWKTPQAAMHGYQGGQPRAKGKNPALETTTKTPAYPDDLILTGALAQMDQLTTAGKPWMLAVGFIKPHLPFTAPQHFLDAYKDVTFPAVPSPAKPTGKSLWHSSGEFRKYMGANPDKDPARSLTVRKHYAASVSYVDSNVGKLLAHLKKSPAFSNTIVILWSDHGFSLGEKQIWGKHHLYHTAIHSPLIIRLPKQPAAGEASASVVETLDLYPTLCDLCGIAKPKHLQGSSLVNIINEPKAKSDGIANSFWGGKKSTITQDTHTITVKGKPFLKFDLTKDPDEENPIHGK